ncbi:hypothetical protein B0J14DRAFT_491760 [Halenospora varia]|nr:hypothetical protein B0J14DRAFT_491760 [Halenospora varia]
MSSQRKRFLFISAAFLILLVLYTARLSFPGSPTTTPSKYSPFTSPTKSSSPDQNPAPKILPGQNAAAIIETRPMDNLAPLILHFSSVLGPGWPISLFAPESAVPKSKAFQRAIESGAVNIHDIPSNLTFMNHNDVSEFLTTTWFWEQLAPASHVLLFQADSIICANAPMHVNDFLQYDFIGAPIDTTLGRGDVGMNGGLSLRNRTMVMEVITSHSWKGELAEAKDVNPTVLYEDQWYYQKLLNTPGARLPKEEEAKPFSVESLWYDTPVGYHQIGKWNMGRLAEIDKFCPEHRLATNDFIHD